VYLEQETVWERGDLMMEDGGWRMEDIIFD
jgi:hypothetical protein